MAQESAKIAKMAKLELHCNMERQSRAKMAELEPRWPKRAPRWSQDGQIGAKMEPTWLQDAKDVSTQADIVPIFKKLHFPMFFPRLWLKHTYNILNAGCSRGHNRPKSVDLNIHLIELSS